MRIRTVDISDEVADVLRRGEWEGTVFILPKGQLDRKLYDAVDKVLRAIGGRWDRGMRGHIFNIGSRFDLETALAAGSIVDQKKTLEQFWTPVDLAARMVELLGLFPARGAMILEPSAGSGRLADAVFAAIPNAAVVAIEKDPALAKALLDRLNFAAQIRVIEADFMTWECDGHYAGQPIDAALMNPPFSGNQDIAHIRRAFDMLRPGGRLAAISSPHWTFATDKASIEFREWIGFQAFPGGTIAVGGMGYAGGAAGAHIESAHIERLPEGTFKESGTGVSALLILIEKAA